MAKDSGSTPSPSSPLDVADRVHSAAIRVLRHVRKVDERSGLTAARLSALSVVVFGGPTSLGRLARAEQVSAPTMSRLVRSMEREGLVVRKGDERDGRIVLVHATGLGRRLLEEGRGHRISELARLLEGLPSDELERLAHASSALLGILARPLSADSAYAAATAERRWSGLSDDSTGSGGTSG